MTELMRPLSTRKAGEIGGAWSSFLQTIRIMYNTQQQRRVAIGIVVGAALGALFSICIITLAIISCIADGGFLTSEPKHAWLADLPGYICNFGTPVMAIAGAIVGIIWARRRNKRMDANVTK